MNAANLRTKQKRGGVPHPPIRNIQEKVCFYQVQTKKKRETGWNRAYIRFYLIRQATEMEHNSRPTERMVSNIASIRSAEGFLVPLTYWANRLCDIPNLRAMAEALSSGCAINTSYKGLAGFFMKNPSKLRSSSISSQWMPSSLSVKLFRCSGVANGCHFL